MTPPRLLASVTLDLRQADPPQVATLWHSDGSLAVYYGQAGQRVGLAGTPQEVRLALASGLAAIDRAVAERAADLEALHAAEGGDAAAELERGPTP